MRYVEFFEKAKEKEITNIQITEKEIKRSSCEVINGKLEDFQQNQETNYQIKAEYLQKTVQVKSNYLAEDILDLICMKTQATDSSYEDDYLEKKENILKEDLPSVEIHEEVKRLKELDSIRIEKEINQLRTMFEESASRTRIVNSNGVDISTNSHFSEFVVEAILEENGETSSYDRMILTTNKQEIPFEEFTANVMDMLLFQKKKEKLETKKYPIILDSYVAGNILSHLIGMTSKENIRNKVSCLGNKLGKKIFHEKVTIVEDPLNEKLPGKRLFDDEGTNTSYKEIVQNGVLKNYLYNIKESKLEEKESTGNGYQGIDVRNMYLLGGEKTKEELWMDMKDGLYITDYMGSSGSAINQINGNISLQVFGYMIKDGKIVSGFMPCVMTTTIFELLENVEEIGNDLTFTNLCCGSPSIYIKDISIAS